MNNVKGGNPNGVVSTSCCPRKNKNFRLYDKLVNSVHVKKYLVYPKTWKCQQTMKPPSKNASPHEALASGAKGPERSNSESWLESINYC